MKKIMKKLYPLIAAVIVIGSLVASCKQPAPTTTTAAGTPRYTVQQYWDMYGKTRTGEWRLTREEDMSWWKPPVPTQKYHFALVIPHVRDPYWIAVAYGAMQAAQELGDITIDCRPAGGYEKLDVMVSDLEDLIAKKVDGMVVSGVDFSAVAVPVEKAWKAGIPTTSALIFTSYGAAPGVTIDDYQTGVVQAGLAAKHLPANAKIFCLNGPPGVEWGKLRAKGFTDTLAKLAPGMKIVGERFHEMDRTITQHLTEDALTTWPDLKLVFATADFQGKGAIAALKSAGKKPGDIGVTGVHMDEESLALLKAGWFSWLVSESAALEGRYAVWMLVHILQGHPVPKKLYVPITAYTPENVAQYESSLVGIDFAAPGWVPGSVLKPKTQ